MSHYSEAENKQPKRQLVGGVDVLEIIYSIADKKGMKVISDLNMDGGAWYGKISADEMAGKMKGYASLYHARYGMHKSFWGWYLNNEINPISTTEKGKSAFWRKVWKAAIDECHRIRPGSMVTVSPFFLLDKDGLWGEHHPPAEWGEHHPPAEYEEWWAVTLAETGIDILMLQDSGQHLGFFTLAEREPFFAAFARACERAGSKLWLNVETGQVDAADWPEAIAMEKSGPKKWEFTEMGWLAQKLELAARYGEGIINWGYYPFMNPDPMSAGICGKNEVDGQKVAYNQQKEAYGAYKSYYEKQTLKDVGTEYNCRPVMRGTLWWLPANYSGWTKERLEKGLEKVIKQQRAVGFDLLWLLNTPANMERAVYGRG